MSNKNLISKPKDKAKKNNSFLYISIGVIAILSVVLLALNNNASDKSTANSPLQGDITIAKSEITSTAKFYPVKVDNTNMEVLAVKASDGSIRTAFNTCQVCYGSGKGYYKQENNELVCQNCKNRFKLDQVEKIKGGCNPVPITKEEKTETSDTITISKEFIAQNKDLFGNWKKQ